MADQTVIKFHSSGPDNKGLGAWEQFSPEIVVSGSPVQKGNVYFSTQDDTVYAGVWDCTENRLVSVPYGEEEFMVVLEGSIIINHESGGSETYSAGESFVIPRGTHCSWEQTEYARKFFFIYEPGGDMPDNANRLKAIRADLTASLPEATNLDPNQFESDVPDMGLLSLYKDPSGQLEVGIWECSPMQRKPATLARSELMHILEGSGSITNADGVVFEFTAGDTFLVPIGMGYQWHNYTCLLYTSPSPRDA